MNILRPGSAKDANVSPERLDHIKDMCAGWVADGSTPALIVLAARHGVVFLHEAWGQLGSGPDSAPVSLDSIFGVASVSKVVTASTVMLLVETGGIGIHQPVQKYLPEFKGPGCEKITIRHLLTHTSGLSCRSEGSLLEAGRNGLEREPGSQMVYSNVGYDLLGLLVEKVSGQSFNEFARQKIFKPLGMKDSTFLQGGAVSERCIRRRPGTTFDWSEDIEGQTQSSSTLWTTAMDMGIFMQTFLNGGCYGNVRLLSPATVAAMTCDQVSGIPREIIHGVPNAPQGFGWFMLEEVRFPNTACLWSPQSYGHAGASGAFVWADPLFDLLGIFFLTKVREEVNPMDLFVDSIMGAIV